MRRLDGRVAFITGAARGQGRAHAVRLAEEGADILAVDVCEQITSVPYPMGTSAELGETVDLVEKLGRRIVARHADVRDRASLQAAVDAGIGELGHIDIIVANAGIGSFAPTEDRDQAWNDVIAVNLSGCWRTLEVAVPHMLERGQGGAIVLISAAVAMKPPGGDTAGTYAYVASKHGVTGLMRNFAVNLAPHGIRVNSVHPGGVDTPMIINDVMLKFAQDSTIRNLLPITLIEPRDISDAVAWLVSDEARYVTGVALPVDAGCTV